jgi:DNA-binding NarL/FixJ family response regulator
MRILIVDDHRIFAQSLAVLLSQMGFLEVVEVVESGRAALDRLSQHSIDLVLSDLQMPQMTGIELTLHIRRRFPNTKVMMLSMVEDVNLIREALRAGVTGFGSKNIDKSELEKALKMIAKGEVYLSANIVHELSRVPAVNQTEVVPDLAQISEREIEVLKLIAQELSTNQIAERLFVSVNTVETHRKNLFRKLGVKNALGLIKFALRHGLSD